MGEGHTKKYFKYAIGEIVLVVIGILIALSINNWNQNRKSQAFESDMLSQIHTNLEIDKLNLSQFARNGRNAIQSSKKILATEITKVSSDSLKFWLGDIVQFDRFQPLTNAYEVLKSKGLDEVSNKELRLLLGSYYEGKSMHIKKSMEDIERTFNVDWLPMLKKHIVEMKFQEYLVLDNFQLFNERGENRNLLIINIDNYGGMVDHIEQGIVLIDRIQTIINSELNLNE
ncbi:MAG: hypothetical protein KJO00_10540 [Bacteroidia bacterium]|nr:hypothetical protein [Bacteroidia bacterium]